MLPLKVGALPRAASVEVEAIAVVGVVSFFFCVFTYTLLPSPVVTQKCRLSAISKDNFYTLLQVGNNKEIGSYFAVVALTAAIFAAIMLKN